MYHIEVMNDKEVLQPAPYDYRKGTKNKVYRATQNVILPGGQLSLSTGLNGDLQVSLYGFLELFFKVTYRNSDIKGLSLSYDYKIDK